MLNDAKQRNEVLTQAYATLHAEYVALKSSQISDPSSGSYAQHYDMTYGSAAGMGMNAGGGVDGLDMDLYVYSDAVNAGYTL